MSSFHTNLIQGRPDPAIMSGFFCITKCDVNFKSKP